MTELTDRSPRRIGAGTQQTREDAARFDALRRETRRHRQQHGCYAYTFEDGAGLLALARDAGAQHILELGTAIGYTACLLASATATTQVETIERDPAHVALARGHLSAAGLDRRVAVHAGDFTEVLTTLDGGFDLVFFDGLAPSRALVAAMRGQLRSDGLLVCGNLNHSHGAERRSIAADFARPDLWQFVASIEGGGTHAYRKIGER